MAAASLRNHAEKRPFPAYAPEAWLIRTPAAIMRRTNESKGTGRWTTRSNRRGGAAGRSGARRCWPARPCSPS
ncbi:hypothetical protein B8V81_0001 [Paenibacillus pasadenensis]|uniref:Uncharacterized protein n=1 Tax=Paenibacillus pasadenensis TaxID=217090 RepID=A0A2N5NBZ5_9BACL|nr:hypothetical protein B8V81_0001 [Paenibacillus pasadenensis]